MTAAFATVIDNVSGREHQGAPRAAVVEASGLRDRDCGAMPAAYAIVIATLEVGQRGVPKPLSIAKSE